jgi:hypothetical protein
LAFPTLKEFNTWAMEKIMEKTANGDASGSKIVIKYNIAARHMIILCYTVGSIATKSTSSVLMAIDFLINICVCLKIVWLNRKSSQGKKQIDLLQELVINELIEFIAPIAYLLIFAAAYVGPNYSLLGNMGATYFHFKEIEDVNKFVENIVMFFAIDLCSLVISAILLWVFCKINLLKAIVALLEEFWFIFGVLLSFYVSAVSK